MFPRGRTRVRVARHVQSSVSHTLINLVTKLSVLQYITQEKPAIPTVRNYARFDQMLHSIQNFVSVPGARGGPKLPNFKLIETSNLRTPLKF